MDKRVLSSALLAVCFLSWIAGFLEFDLTFLALTCVVSAAGAITAIWLPRTGYAVLGAMALAWVVTFPTSGISVISTIAAVGFVGFGLIAFGIHRESQRLQLIGVGAAALGNLWYVVDNSLLTWFPKFAIGNWIFTVACVLIGLAIRESMRNESSIPIVTAEAPKTRATSKKANRAKS